MKRTLILIVAALALTACSSTTDSGATEKYDAERVCKDFVKDRLKSPGSADFSDVSTSGGLGAYTVVGSVDSQNSFGALIRNEFTCKVHLNDSGDRWLLDGVSGLVN